MHADSVYVIGDGHQVCEDYARSGCFSDMWISEDGLRSAVHYALVSDGCSGSKDTDIGSRLIINAAERMIHECGSVLNRDALIGIVVTANATRRLMGLSNEIEVDGVVVR